jgi:DNA-binding MarR family transcriptional regulator
MEAEAAHGSNARALGIELGRQTRCMHLLKAQMVLGAPLGLDFAAFGLLLHLLSGGPRRQGELADMTLLDPSTVSRQVGQLVRAGLVERRPHPEDGRAVQLVPTPSGRALGEEVSRRRDTMLEQVVSHWADEDVDTLVRLLGRLTQDLENHRSHLQKQGPAEPSQATNVTPLHASSKSQADRDPAIGHRLDSTQEI